MLLVCWLGLFGAVLGVLAAHDIRTRRLPNQITYSGTIVALLVAALVGLPQLGDAMGGMLIAGGLASVAWWFGRGGLGLGDVKLSFLVGGVVGVGGAIPFLVMSTFVGAVAAFALLIGGRGRHATFPYGPALVVGAVLALHMTALSTAAG